MSGMAHGAGWRKAALLAVLAGALMAACNRDRLEPSPCVGDRPMIARTLDVAPPNCAPVPGTG